MDNTELPYIDAAEFEAKVAEYAENQNRVLYSILNNPRSKIKTWQDMPPHLIQDLFKRLGCKPSIQKY